MRACGSCRRHLYLGALACPFCGATQPQLVTASGLGLAFGLAINGCGSDEIAGGAQTSSSTTAALTSAATTTSLATAGDTRSSATTDDAMATHEGAATSETTDGDCPRVLCGFYGVYCECDTFRQVDCADDFGCVPFVGTACVPAGMRGAGEACALLGYDAYEGSDCEPGTECILTDALANEGICVLLCSGTNCDPTCPEGLDCGLAEYSGYCTAPCAPLGDDCTAVESCDVAYGQTYCWPVKVPPAQLGEHCERHHECAPGLTCLPGPQLVSCFEGSCCTPFCDPTSTDPCPVEGTTCVGESHGYGICRRE